MHIFRYRHNICSYCSLVCIVVVSLSFYNHTKFKEYRDKQAKIDSVLDMRDSINLEIENEKVLNLQEMNKRLEQQTDTLSSRLSILTTEIKRSFKNRVKKVK